MTFHFQQAVRAVILLAFSGMLFMLHFSGDITKLINPKYVGLSQSASIIFLFLFFIQITRIWTDTGKSHHHCHDDHACGHDHGDSSFNAKKLISYAVIVVPILTGFFLPAKVLDASIANKKGGMAVLSHQNQNPQEKKDSSDSKTATSEDLSQSAEDNISVKDDVIDPGLASREEVSKEKYDQLIKKLQQSPKIKMNDYVYAAYYEEISKDIKKFKGRKIELKGFVYKEDGFGPNQLVISRFLITHCVADASIIGFLSEIPDASSLKEDTWIEATGILDVTTYNGTELPTIKITDLKKTSEPKEPYLYPINVKLL
ncbi:TIGR03943 family putative permease subunit [Peribacillus deserti]|uniref:TIGR03943 family protein n=1 Tax=Peribacillus deserti TaxID=673318 RepID=A0A2N5M9W8_9BACI|nr:TIGR03943 family protein [Peribacillus deserti]PLT31160.1 TIGR03943 family protein [Peribacillus deserti]